MVGKIVNRKIVNGKWWPDYFPFFFLTINSPEKAYFPFPINY